MRIINELSLEEINGESFYYLIYHVSYFLTIIGHAIAISCTMQISLLLFAASYFRFK